MNHEKKAESLAAVIISVFILSIALLWIMNIVSFSRDTAINYEWEILKHILISNSEILVKKVDSDNLKNDEVFYINKNSDNLEFEVLTWSTNSGSKYIDVLGNRIENLNNAIGKTYIREFTHKTDILKHAINPDEIPNIVFHIDAQNIDEEYNSTLSDGDNISLWKDLSWNNLNAYSENSVLQPTLNNTSFHGKPIVTFWDNKALTIDDDSLINNDWDNSIQTTYNQKSFAIVFSTWDNVEDFQTIYEQGWTSKWYNLVIDDFNIYAWAWNTDEWDSWNHYKSVSLGEAAINTTYYITIVHDSVNQDISDDSTSLKFYLNDELVSDQKYIDKQYEHSDGIWIWAVNWDSVRISDHSQINQTWYSGYFQNWWIAELIFWNHALTQAEIIGLHNYLSAKWWEAKYSVNYSIIDTYIDKYYSN